MKKTLSIHIGKQLFTIEEDAYSLLQSYLERLERKFQNEQGKEEIIEDIEYRFAELFASYLQSSRVVVEESDVKQAIDSLGQIEDFEAENENVNEETNSKKDNSEKQNFNSTNASGQKRLFRDTDNRILGGVCAGLSHYLGIDVVFVRIIFILCLMLGFGFGLYLVLWIVFPSIKSPADRLQMQGKAVTVDTIKEEFNKAGQRIKNDTKDLDKRIKKHTDKLNAKVNPAIKTLLRVFGVFILVGTLVYLLFATLISTGILDVIPTTGEEYYISIYEFLQMAVGDQSNLNLIWLGGLMGVFAIGFFWLIIGTRMVTNNYSKALRYGVISMIFLGIIGFSLAFIGGVKTSREFAESNRLEKQSFTVNKGELKIDLLPTFYRSHKVADTDGFDFLNFDKKNFIESGIDFKFIESDDSLFHITQYYSSKGVNNKQAGNRAFNIKHKVELKENTLLVDPNYTFPIKDAMRRQRVSFTVEIPKGKTCYFGKEHVILEDKKMSGFLDQDGDDSFEIYNEFE
jgi:phage shock protein PspC (stress-responsive transcriptional regulator)